MKKILFSDKSDVFHNTNLLSVFLGNHYFLIVGSELYNKMKVICKKNKFIQNTSKPIKKLFCPNI